MAISSESNVLDSVVFEIQEFDSDEDYRRTTYIVNEIYMGVLGDKNIPDKFLHLCQSALNWANKNGNSDEIMMARYRLCTIHAMRLDYLDVVRYGTELIADPRFMEREESMNVLQDLRTAYFQVEHYDPIFEIIARLKSQSIKFDKELAYNTNRGGELALIHYRVQNYTEAINEYQTFWNALMRDSLLFDASSISNNIGLCFYDLNQTDSAEFYFQKSLKLIISAKRRGQQSQSYMDHFTNVVRANLANIWVDKGLFEKALPIYQDELTSSMREREPHITLSAFYNIAKIYFKLKKYKLSLSYIDSAEKYVIITPSSLAKKKLLLLKSKNYNFMGEKERSLAYLLEYEKFVDSIENHRAQQDYLTAAARYNFNKKDLELAYNKTLLANKKRERIYEYLAILILGIFTIVLIFSIRRAFKTNKLIKQQQAQAEHVLREKETLLKEIHHRVKNNLNTVSGLFYMQSRKTQSPEFRQLVEDSQRQIQSIALVHQMFYAGDDLAYVDMNEYTNILCEQIMMGYVKSKIKFRVVCDEIWLTLDQATPIGLLINELMSNTFKHAYPEKKGEILLTIKKEGELAILKYKDFGKGLPLNFEPEKAMTMGLRLVRMISEEIDGKLRFLTGAGFGIELIFKIKEND